MLKIWCLLHLFVGIILNQAFASSPLVLSEDTRDISVLSHTEYFEDPGRTLSIQDLLQLQPTFVKQSGSYVDYGYSKSNHWSRFTVLNKTQEKDWYLQVSGSIAREINIFAVNDGQGDPINKMKWSIANRYHLVIPPAAEITLYIQLYDHHGIVMFSPYLSNTAAHMDTLAFSYTFHAFVLAGLLVLAAYNFLYYLHLRDMAFLTLSVFIVANAITIADNEGVLNFFPWIPHYFGWLGACFIFLVVVSGLRLTLSLLDIRQQLPDMVIWYDLGSFLGIALMLTTLVFGNAMPIGAILCLCGIGLVLVSFFKLNKLNYQVPKSLSIAIAIFVIGVMPLLLTIIGVVEYLHFFTKWFFLSALVALLIMSLTQAEKIRLKGEYIERTVATNKAKDEFLTTMSHELRTPMNAVVGAGRLLELTPLSNEQTEYVSRLNESSDHMLLLVNDLLDLARVDHKQLPLESIPFKLENLIHTLKHLLSESASNKQLELHFDNHFIPLEKQLLGDPTRLNQVLINLLGNAIKFTQSGKVSLAITPVELTAHRVSLNFEVSDTGIGLTKKQLKNLFQPFTQAESSTNRQYGGSGLGLAISQKLVSRMDGDLQVSSQPKKGSSFSFTLAFPLTETSLQDVQETRFLPINLKGHKVLLVDDDEMNRFFGQKLLETCMVEAVAANSGKAAIALMQQQPFDLVFMDVSMPEVDGYETVRRLRSIPELQHSIVVALTAHAIAGERERCIAAGMNDYLTKPFEIDDLRKMMVKWLVTQDS